MNKYSNKVAIPSYLDFGENENLLPLLNYKDNLKSWESIHDGLKKEWLDIIGYPSFQTYEKTVKVIKLFNHTDFNGYLYKQSTGPTSSQLVFLMTPKNLSEERVPGAIVPFYHPDSSAGYNLEKEINILERPNIQFGRHLVRQGYIVVCPEAFPFNTVPEPNSTKEFAWWQAAADKILKNNPEWTGIGKLIWDTQCALDILFSQKNLDKKKVLTIGHSLGGKMAFYTAAFDDRITATIASDFGIGWNFTNWSEDWYFGKQIKQKSFHHANHEILSLIAPRPFLLIGGEFDGPASWQYINEAKKIYGLYKKEDKIGFIDHGSGHYPPECAIDLAYHWLAEQFNYSCKRWKV